MSARVLIVEDESALCELLERMLRRKFDVDVDLAGNGKVGLNKANANVYDLIFSDIRMPEMDGVSMVHSIRAGAGPNATTPIVMVTGFHEEGRLAARKFGARFVAKPFRRQALLNAISDVLVA